MLCHVSSLAPGRLHARSLFPHWQNVKPSTSQSKHSVHHFFCLVLFYLALLLGPTLYIELGVMERWDRMMKSKGKKERKTRWQGYNSKSYGAPPQTAKMGTLPLCLSVMGLLLFPGPSPFLSQQPQTRVPL